MMGFEEWAEANIEAGGKGLRRNYNTYAADIKAGGTGDGRALKQDLLGQGGTGTEEQRRTGGMKGGSFEDDSPDAGNYNTGDPYLDELRSGKVAGSEDWRRFSNQELKGWEQYYVGGGKYKNAYGDIVGKPMDSGPNTPKGMDGLGNPIEGGGGRGGRGGRGRGRGGRSQAAPPPSPFALNNMDPLQNMLENLSARGGNIFGQDSAKPGMEFAGGGVWNAAAPTGAPPPATPPPGTPGAPPAAPPPKPAQTMAGAMSKMPMFSGGYMGGQQAKQAQILPGTPAPTPAPMPTPTPAPQQVMSTNMATQFQPKKKWFQK